MAEEEIRHPDGRIEHPSVRSEKTDVSFRWIVSLLVGAMVLAAVIHYAVLLFFYGYNDYQSELRKSPYPLAPAPSGKLPPEPRLEQLDRMEGIERANVYVREATKEAVLTSYGPTPEKGFVHVPIDRAIKHLVGKLPARKEQAESGRRDSGLVDAGEPNSGRIFRGRPKWSEK
jgi:hypothetical protein